MSTPDLNLNYFARNLQPSSRVMPHLFVLLDAVLRRIPRPGSQRKQVGHTLGEEKNHLNSTQCGEKYN